MFFINLHDNNSLNMFIKLFNFKEKLHTNNNLLFWAHLNNAIFNFIILILLFSCFLNFIMFLLFNQNKKTLQLFNFLSILILMIFGVFKLKCALIFEKISGIYIEDIRLSLYEEYKQHIMENFFTFNSSLSDIILILSLITTFFCIIFLGEKNLFENVSNISIFFLFNLFIFCMISSNNLFIIFLSFEGLFLPGMYFVYKLGYNKKIQKSIVIFFKWTFFGSFLVLCSLLYVFFQYKTLNYHYLYNSKFSYSEIKFLTLFFILGFSTKIPLPPFHTWLLKIHVDAPTGFSMFLSGFLVKSALFCLIFFLSIFNNKNILFFFFIWIFIGLFWGTLGLGISTDLKKIVAWATIQEMTYMLLFACCKQFIINDIFILFIFLHGLLSIYLFFIVDIIYKRFKTRSILLIKGLAYNFPELVKYIWFVILLFCGFPLTVKFYIEWQYIILAQFTGLFFCFFIIIFINIIGSLLFCKKFISILYGIDNKIVNSDFKLNYFFNLSEIEYYLLNLLILLIGLLSLFIYFY